MFLLAETLADGVGQFTSLGAAGVMGAMWFFERRNAQQRDRQLDEAHARILGDRVQLDQLIEVVRSNAEALTRLSSVQDHLIRTLERGGGGGGGGGGVGSRG
jgi:hypothetical protein